MPWPIKLERSAWFLHLDLWHHLILHFLFLTIHFSVSCYTKFYSSLEFNLPEHSSSVSLHDASFPSFRFQLQHHLLWESVLDFIISCQVLLVYITLWISLLASIKLIQLSFLRGRGCCFLSAPFSSLLPPLEYKPHKGKGHSWFFTLYVKHRYSVWFSIWAPPFQLLVNICWMNKLRYEWATATSLFLSLTHLQVAILFCYPLNHFPPHFHCITSGHYYRLPESL